MTENKNSKKLREIAKDNALVQSGISDNPQKQAQRTLGASLRHLLSQQGYPVDNVRMQDIIRRQAQSGKDMTALGSVNAVLSGVGVKQLPEVFSSPDPAFLPLLAYHPKLGWGLIDAQTPQGHWNFNQAVQNSIVRDADLTHIVRIRLNEKHIKQRNFNFSQLLRQDLSNYKGIVLEAVVASFVINFLALAVSLFSMQVYDRVIPTRSEYTLIILASGVALVILFEAFMKFSRSKIMDKVVVGLDQFLSREVFQRLLKVRIDQMPGSVGTMAAQLRGYEQVRGFFTASTLFGLVDLPMSIIFIVLIAYIGSPIVAIVPIVAAVIALTMGLFARKRIDEIAAEGAAASYYKTGLLVETVEGVETVKAGAGSWKFLSRWLDVMNITVKNDLDMKHANDYLSYFTQMLQQISYVGIVITGSYVVIAGNMTMGGLIACSILGGRILAPVMAIPNILVQYAHAKAAKKNIDSLFELEQDNHGVEYPLSPTQIKGAYQCTNLVFNYLGNDRSAVNVKNLKINPGERIAILGPIGSGKSTLLKLLSGLYAPTQGRILLDGLDIQQISRESLSEQVGYLQQDHRLFQGTLRENLLIGMAAPNDDVLHDAMKKTGLINLVASHSSGLDLPISEGGRGLSGGQKQLVAFTRLLLTKPSVLLLDEPTASMDNRQEQRCLHVLRNELQEGQTLVVSTHKTALLELVDRLIIMDNQQIVLDGPKEAVLQKLMENEQAKAGTAQNQKVAKVNPTTATDNAGNNVAKVAKVAKVDANADGVNQVKASKTANKASINVVTNTEAKNNKPPRPAKVELKSTIQPNSKSAQKPVKSQSATNSQVNKNTPTQTQAKVDTNNTQSSDSNTQIGSSSSNRKPKQLKRQPIRINPTLKQSEQVDQVSSIDSTSTTDSKSNIASQQQAPHKPSTDKATTDKALTDKASNERKRPKRQPIRIQPASEE